MLKVLLVDDEPFILEGLSVLIDWNKEGFEIAAKVSNAYEALEVLAREQIDLMITDIKMPGMTGLELVEKIRREKLSGAYFAMLSGYNDFEYVRTALHNECLDYLLKPIDKEELLRMLDRVRQCFEALRQKQRETNAFLGGGADFLTSLRNFDPGSDVNRNDADRTVDKQLIDELIRAVKINDREDISRYARQLYADMTKEKSDAAMINMAVNYLMFELLHLASEQDENCSQGDVVQFIREAALDKADSEDDEASLTALLLEYGDYLMDLRASQSHGVLSRIEEDIKQNYKENLTLKDMGKKYYVNAAYLGQSFKKQYGESFKDYLNRVRIEKAVELLLYSDKKIYEIAEEVGYKDLDYFINKFIALKGCTPAKYRKQVK